MMSANAAEVERLRRELLEANETLEAIRNGEVDAFVVQKRGSFQVEALAGADTPYRVLVESIRDGALTISRAGTILYCNQAFADSVADSTAAIIGRSVSEWLGLASCDFEVFLDQAAGGESSESGSLRCRSGDLPVAVTACALRSEEDRTVYCLLLRDQSDRVAADQLRLDHARLARQRAELDAICRRLPFAVLMAETPSSFNYHNPVAETLLERFPELGSPARLAIQQVLEGGPVEGQEIVLPSPSGDECTFRLHAATLAIESAGTAVLVVLADVTEQRVAERERERQEHLREMFVGMLGHDLRAPLMAVTTAASLLQRRLGSEQVGITAARIQRASERMKRLVDDMLDFTLGRIGGGIPLSASEVDLVQVVQPVIDELASKPEASFQLEVQGDLRGEWDALRLTQVVTNLLVNAVEYGAAGQPVRIQLDGSSQARVRFLIHNEGPVIPPEILPHIFDPFRQGKKSNLSRGAGVGLGLYIAERIVSAHAGSISVTSREGEGTTFTVELPRRVGRS